MAASERPIIETRHDQMFPVLEPTEIDRLRRFGEPRAYGAGERLSTTGEIGPEMESVPISRATEGAVQFMAIRLAGCSLAALSARASGFRPILYSAILWIFRCRHLCLNV